jgi:hypothetical protein
MWGAFERLRRLLLAAVAVDGWQRRETAPLPVNHPSRVRGADGWQGPGGLVAGFGYDAAHREWFYGFRLAVRTDLGGRLVRVWGVVPAAAAGGPVPTSLRSCVSPPDGFRITRFCTKPRAVGLQWHRNRRWYPAGSVA